MNTATSKELLTVPEGSLGRALDFIRTKEEFSGIAAGLFANIFIVKDLKAALALIASGNHLMYVTLDGDVIEPSGAVITGAVKGVFKRKREIRELESIIEKNRKKIDHIQSDLSSAQQLVETKEADLKDIQSALVDKEKEVSLLLDFKSLIGRAPAQVKEFINNPVRAFLKRHSDVSVPLPPLEV